MVNHIISTISIVFAFACLRLVAGTNVKGELKKISQFLADKGASENPTEILGLIRSDDAINSGILAHSILSLNDATDCDQRKSVAKVSKYLPITMDERVRSVIRHVTKVYFDRCRSGYEAKLAGAFSEMSEKQQRKMLSMLGDDFVEHYHSLDANMVEDIMAPSEAGLLFNRSLPLIVDSIRAQISIKDLDLRLKKHNFAAAKLLANRLGKSCPAFHLNSRPIIQEMRQLITIVDPAEGVKLTSSSDSLRANVFRYKYCEDVDRIRKSAKLMNIIRRSLKDSQIDAEIGSLVRNRRFIPLLLIPIVIGGTLILAFLAFALEAWIRSGLDPVYP